MRKSLLLSLVCVAVVLFTVGCPGNKPPRIPAKPSGPETLAVFERWLKKS